MKSKHYISRQHISIAFEWYISYIHTVTVHSTSTQYRTTSSTHSILEYIEVVQRSTSTTIIVHHIFIFHIFLSQQPQVGHFDMQYTVITTATNIKTATKINVYLVCISLLDIFASTFRAVSVIPMKSFTQDQNIQTTQILLLIYII